MAAVRLQTSAPAWSILLRQSVSRTFSRNISRSFSLTSYPLFANKMDIEITAPNGKTWTQPLGLFIDNEFVKSSNDQKLASINPTYVCSLSFFPSHRDSLISWLTDLAT